MLSKSSMRTDTKRVRGLGTAHSGTGHFWLQRLSALALIPVSVWFLASIIGTFLTTSDMRDAAMWFQNPIHAGLMLIFVLALAIHAKLGIQVIIEDYVHCEAKKIALLIFNSAAMLIFALAGIFAIAHLHFIGI